MIRGWALLSVLVLASCGDPCAREARIAERRCDVEVAPQFDTGEQQCSNVDEKEARCAISHKEDFCEWLHALEAGNVVENDYVRCLKE